MDLAELNASVTDAILRAERLPSGSWEAQTAFREVSELEEAIASHVGAKEVDGEIARLGAVAAALSAGEQLRAIQLAERYLSDDLSSTARARLMELRLEAETELERAARDEPGVEPVRFQLDVRAA